MRPIPYLVCVLCVQAIAGWRAELALPDTTSVRRRELEELVRGSEGLIQDYKRQISSLDRQLAPLRAALHQLGESIRHWPAS